MSLFQFVRKHFELRMAAMQGPEPVYVLRGHRAAVQCVSFFPDCSALAAGDAEGELKLWDLDTRREASSIRAHESHAGVLQVACLNSSSNSSSSSLPAIVRQPVQEVAGGSYNFCRFALLQPGQSSSSCSMSTAAFTAGTAGQAGCSAAAPESSSMVEGFRAPAASASSSAADQTADADGGRSNQQQRASTGLLSKQLRQQEPLQGRNCVLQGRHQQCSLHHQEPAEQLRGLDLSEEAEEDLVNLPHTKAASTAATSPGEDQPEHTTSSGCSHCMLALPSVDAASVGVWCLSQPAAAAAAADLTSSSGSLNTQPNILLQQHKTNDRATHGLCMALALCKPQGSPLHVLAGYEDGTVALWDVRRTDKYVSAEKLHAESVMSLAAAPGCLTGFSGAADDVLAAFDISIPEGRISLARKMVLAKPGISDVAIRPDNRIAASAGWDGKIRIWHAVKCQPLAILKWHNQQVAAVTFSSDSQSLAAAGRDNQISMWNLYPPA